MIDLVLHGTRPAIQALLQARGLVNATGGALPGFDYCWWAGSGNFAITKPVYDSSNPFNVITPATYLPNSVVLTRVDDPADAITEGTEQWQRSVLAKWLKDNGTLGTVGGFPCYTTAGVDMLRASDVFAWVKTQGLASHEWSGGNAI